MRFLLVLNKTATYTLHCNVLRIGGSGVVSRGISLYVCVFRGIRARVGWNGTWHTENKDHGHSLTDSLITILERRSYGRTTISATRFTSDPKFTDNSGIACFQIHLILEVMTHIGDEGVTVVGGEDTNIRVGSWCQLIGKPGRQPYLHDSTHI